MSIRHGLLALLEHGPRYGSQLRTEFEARTGATWPLNIGQVYTTLARLERDGLVAQDGDDEAGHVLYAVTEAGRAELRNWFERPVDRASPPRDELAIKLAMAVGAPGVDIRAVIQAQRHATLKAMQDYTRLKARALVAVESVGSGESAGSAESDRGRDDIAWLLVLEQLIFRTEAEARWLDHCESRLARLSATAARTGISAHTSATSQPSTASQTSTAPRTAATSPTAPATRTASGGGTAP
ncbi:helix-turn-helix transcriptional regulator [Streptomyces hypolithicus]